MQQCLHGCNSRISRVTFSLFFNPRMTKPCLPFIPASSCVSLLSLVFRTLGNHSNGQQVARAFLHVCLRVCVFVCDVKTKPIKLCLYWSFGRWSWTMEHLCELLGLPLSSISIHSYQTILVLILTLRSSHIHTGGWRDTCRAISSHLSHFHLFLLKGAC